MCLNSWLPAAQSSGGGGGGGEGEEGGGRSLRVRAKKGSACKLPFKCAAEMAVIYGESVSWAGGVLLERLTTGGGWETGGRDGWREGGRARE